MSFQPPGLEVYLAYQLREERSRCVCSVFFLSLKATIFSLQTSK